MLEGVAKQMAPPCGAWTQYLYRLPEPDERGIGGYPARLGLGNGAGGYPERRQDLAPRADCWAVPPKGGGVLQVVDRPRELLIGLLFQVSLGT